ncbi:uncharacterized protein EV422DRAFT_619834 [Fimicolochytrium jonesii]|uniref:uncharacterized protein n=1 Tax=Fimicolochytrium jonesii TaxID=1396493 RepID=UPI0022FEBC3C|nr:uncharacterized protein EV422DRAFT_619834 [Fimicolochytrium jonesii]KAI8821503.1 hypothetical protein EV422DRAFT_619834 [Fimicolochytrium jonesii]
MAENGKAAGSPPGGVGVGTGRGGGAEAVARPAAGSEAGSGPAVKPAPPAQAGQASPPGGGGARAGVQIQAAAAAAAASAANKAVTALANGSIGSGARPPPNQAHLHGDGRMHKTYTPDEQAAIAAELKFQAEHAGHESQHATMGMILLATLVGSQILFALWRKHHLRSFQAATLLGLWLVPAGMSLQGGYTRFLVIWGIFSVINSLIVWRAHETPLRSTTPRWVYKWYTLMYNIWYAVGMLGYILVLLSFFHVPLILHLVQQIDQEVRVFEFGIITLFYGLYFGTLSRDFVARLADRMALTVGYYSRTGLPAKHLRSNMCAICGASTTFPSDPTTTPPSVHTLNCGHKYHESCIRGWTIIGKKDVCPYCKEKVDLKDFRRNPWDTTQQVYLNLLDALRYLLVWNPIVFLVINVVFRLFDLK